ncbi:negative cofactor 2 alpha [Anticarsia gemmatalis]|uniref:negative cofactor 2 alpha n=1 Tax=Anticarsia gemmatalis TaxID=129554 RepID=UPI003F76A677
MPTKKRKYNARFPAGRIKKIMQTDEEVGKVAQAVPIIISRTLELFVESLLSKAMQVTVARNAKTLSPSHVKQCILAESKFDFLRDLVKNIPDVSAAEEKEMMSAESSPNSSRFSDMSVPPRRIAREDSNSSSSCDVKIVPLTQPPPGEHVKRALSSDTELPNKTVRTETVTSTHTDTAIDLSKKTEEKPVVTANFYQETLLTEDVPHRSVITVNPSYNSPQPSTSYTPEPIKLEPLPPQKTYADKPRRLSGLAPANKLNIPMLIPAIRPIKPMTPTTPKTPVTPILNIDFSKNVTKPEIKLLDVAVPKNDKNSVRQLHRQNSKPAKTEVKKIEVKPIVTHPVVPVHPVDIDSLNSGNLQIDEDYDT